MAGPGGARPGAGRPKGSRGKVNIQKALRAELTTAEAKASGRKLAIDVLEDFMHLFAGMAAVYQPLPPGVAAAPGRTPDEERFEKYARLTLDFASDLAKYQSPTFGKVMLIPPPDIMPLPKPIAGELSRLTPQESYRLMKDAEAGEVVEAKPGRRANG